MRKICPNEKSSDLSKSFIAGRTTRNRGIRWHSLRIDDWNLVGLLSGEGHVSIEGKDYLLCAGRLYLFAPMNTPRFFYTRQWDGFWLHTRLNQPPEWTKAGPSFFCAAPPPSVFRKMMNEFQEAVQIILDRKQGWHQLAMSLISTVLIRGSLLESNNNRIDERCRKAETLLADLGNTGNMDDIAKACGMSRSLFFSMFRSAYGISPHLYRSGIQIDRACCLLETTDLELDLIAEQCGWKDRTSFFKQFKQAMGQTPGAYRKECLARMN